MSYWDKVSESIGTSGGGGGVLDKASEAIGTAGGSGGILNDVSKGLGTDGTGGGLANEIKTISDAHMDLIHRLHSPFIDTQLGRMALRVGGTYFGGPLGGALVSGGLGVNDAANGRSQNNLSNLFSAAMSGYGAYNAPAGAVSPYMAGGGQTLGQAAGSIGSTVAKNYAISKVPHLGTAMSLYKGVAGDPLHQGENMVGGLGSLYLGQQNRNMGAPQQPQPLNSMFNSGAPSPNTLPRAPQHYNISKIRHGRNWTIEGQ